MVATKARQQAGLAASIIVPTYNERDNIRTVVDRCSHTLKTADFVDGFEIIVVDDDSPDGTWRLVEEAYSTDDRVRVIRRTENHGLALSVVDGFYAASMEYCVVIDGDLQHPPEKIPELLAALDRGADISIGSRHLEDGGIEDWTRFRKLVSRGATALAKRLLPTIKGVSDPMSGLFAIRRSILEEAELQPQGYKILLEILSKCDIDRIAEVPYTFHDRAAGQSNLSADQYRQFVGHLLHLSVAEHTTAATETARIVRMIKFFGVGAVGVVVNMAVFLLLMDANTHYLLSGGLAFVAAVQWNFVGNWAITFGRPRDALAKRYISFHAVCLVGLAVYEVALSLLLLIETLPLLVVNFGAIASSSLWNFLGADTTAFADDTDSTDIGARSVISRGRSGGVEGGDN